MTDSSQYCKLPQYNEKGEPYPWKDEPNFAYYTDENTGLDYFINRHHSMGFLCGYVVVEKDDLPLLRPMTDLCGGSEDEQFEVHGGATFCDKFNWKFFKKSPVYCIGFDCAHGWDIIPGIPGMLDEPDIISITYYRDIKYVQEECKKLAAQVADYLKKHREYN